MFDINDPADLLTLKTEEATDPIGMGYASAANTTQLLVLFNDPDSNVGAETTGAKFTPELVLEVVEPSDLTTGGLFNEGEQTWFNTLMSLATYLDVGFAAYKDKFISIFPANSTTINNLEAKIRLLSRMEVLFGEGTVVTKADWYAARDS